MRLRVTIEGPQGSGKSTLAQVLARFCLLNGIPFSYSDDTAPRPEMGATVFVENLRSSCEHISIETQLDAMSKAHAIAFAEAAEKVLAESSKPSFRDAA